LAVTFVSINATGGPGYPAEISFPTDESVGYFLAGLKAEIAKDFCGFLRSFGFDFRTFSTILMAL
jgi:hypothetical protein